MKLHYLIVLLCLLLSAAPLAAINYAEETTRTENVGQLRLDLTYTHPLPHQLSIVLFEDVRFDFVPFVPSTLFDLSLTSVSLVYSPFPYLKTEAAYMLKISGPSSSKAANNHWNDPNNFIKHRVYGGVIGIYTVGNWSFVARERLLWDMRFDDIDRRTTNQHQLTLRHFLKTSYSFKNKGINPYLWTELANTLNANEYCRLNGHQYIERWRTCAGVNWKIPAEDKNRGTLNFFFRYDWGRFRSAEFSGDDILLTTRRRNEYAIGIGYEFTN